MPCFRGLCLGILLMLLAGSSFAQGIRRTPKSPPKLPPFNLSGTLESIEGSDLVLTTAAKYTWVLRPKPKAHVQVSITGKATPAFLAPGQAVAFFAKLDTRNGSVLEEVRRLTVFTPNERRPLGIQPDLGFGDLEKATFEQRRQTREPKPSDDKPQVSQADSVLPGDAADARQGKHSSRRTPPKHVDSFVVHGTILSIKKGELLVQSPSNGLIRQTKLTATVAADAEISVELVGPPALLLLVQPGDHVQASGEQTGECRGDATNLRFRIDRLLGAPPDVKKRSEKKETESKTP
jgi:hypothetical protein